jgi:hypothetical protein
MGAMWLKLSLVSGKADLFSVYVKKHLGQKSHQREYTIGRMVTFYVSFAEWKKKESKDDPKVLSERCPSVRF